MSGERALAWCDGRIVEGDRPLWPSLDRSVLYGDGLFETVRLAAGVAIELDAHLARFRASAEALGYADPDGLVTRGREAAEALLVRGGGGDGVLRITWTRGSGGRGFAPGADAEPRVVAHRFALPGTLAERRRGVRAVVLPDLVAGSLSQHKTTSTIVYVEAARIARARGVEEALLTDGRGRLTEASAANLFVVRAGRCLTPPAEGALLPGVTRAWVLRAAPAEEAVLETGVLAEAEEAFLTGSVSGVTPLLAVDGRAVGDGRPGPLTRRLQSALDERLASAGRRA